MAVVTIDSDDQSAILAHARGEKPAAAPKPADKASDSAQGEAKTQGETQSDPKALDPDDVEGEDGLTPREKRQLSATMRRAIDKNYAKRKTAEELAASAESFATDQYNQARLAEQRAENLERELQRLKEAQIRVEAPKELAEPKREDFQNEQAYQDARVDWRAEQKFLAKQQEAQQQAEAERQQQVLEQASARVAAAVQLVPDFASVTQACDWPPPPYIKSYMQESEMFAELGYFLAKPEQAALRDKLSKMRPEAALVEIGKIESKLSPFASKEAKPNGHGADKPSTDAPVASSMTDASQSRSRAAVITPLSSGSALQADKDPREMSPAEALADWQKKHGVNLQARKRH